MLKHFAARLSWVSSLAFMPIDSKRSGIAVSDSKLRLCRYRCRSNRISLVDYPDIKQSLAAWSCKREEVTVPRATEKQSAKATRT
ncbi:hypothetical protein EJ03DRAFT_193754 [Teratosphaeria nubilosa]|uniref:Uncharacterized protein n=1 Tax=Teratosphaeria nubilosa TaxID=161662 RepID=A0A6G1L117_9PEZI|nr:hypothetical protein EJ03DRAFT_193754 [Teratosphaeria nubilosa]